MQHTYWLIWSTEHKGWWKPARRGYTQNLSEAGVYEYQEAVNIVHGANISLLHSNTAIPNESMILLQGLLKEKYLSTKIKP